MAMNVIYESASLVLVCAYGDSMDFGTYGLSRERPITQHHVETAGLRITNPVREIAEDPLSLWQTRGWTYQEAVCAKELLHSSNTRAYYECQTSTYYENMYNLETEINDFSAYGLRLQHEDTAFGTFARHLANYSSRKLSFSSDAYSAFVGIANLLYGYSYVQNFCWGLPRVDFDRALRWYAWDGKNPLNRVEIQLKNMTVVFPTWSWASAMVHEEQVRYQKTAFYKALVLWSAKSVFTELWQLVSLGTNTKVDDDWEIYMALADREGCFQGCLIPESSKLTNFSAVRDKFRGCWANYRDFCGDAFQRTRIHEELEKQYLYSNATRLGFLLTVAQASHFRVSERLSHYGLRIVDLDDNIAGQLCGEVTRFRDDISSGLIKDGLYEFVAISLPGLHIYPYTGKERTTKNYVDETGATLDTLPVVNVLLIERKDDLAYRKELGWVYLQDWAKANRRWEPVVLG